MPIHGVYLQEQKPHLNTGAAKIKYWLNKSGKYQEGEYVLVGIREDVCISFLLLL